MPSLIILMIVGAALFAYWNAARAAAEHAKLLGRNACAAAQVMWLDESVHASGIRVRRNEDGKLGFEEWAGKTTAKFAGADKDKSATLTRAEFLTTAPKPRKATPKCACPKPTAPVEDTDD
jgi:hypothetical protein